LSSSPVDDAENELVSDIVSSHYETRDAPMTPFPIPLITPPETTMYFMVGCQDECREQRKREIQFSIVLSSMSTSPNNASISVHPHCAWFVATMSSYKADRLRVAVVSVLIGASNGPY